MVMSFGGNLVLTPEGNVNAVLSSERVGVVAVVGPSPLPPPVPEKSLSGVLEKNLSKRREDFLPWVILFGVLGISGVFNEVTEVEVVVADRNS